MKKPFFLFVLLSIFFRIVFSLNIGLIDDEAYHWSWTKPVQLSYFDHPAMVAWLEGLSTWLWGDTVFAVRFPSFMLYLATLFFSWKLSRELFGEISARIVVVLLLWSPFWGFGGYVASPETPFMFFWILSAWIFWNGMKPNSPWSQKKTWLLLGVTMGLGLNSKFITALLAPGFALYLLMTSDKRKTLLQRWPWLGFLVATLVCLPIFLWNSQHGWPGFKYQFHDRHTGDPVSVARWLGWFGAQWALFTPIVYGLVLLTWAKAFRRRHETRWRFILSLATPSLLIFSLQPFFADYKPHWSGSAVLILALGIGAVWSEGWSWRYKTVFRPSSRKIMWTTISILIFFNVLIYAPFASPWLPKVYRQLWPTQEWKTTNDLSNEFFGWEELGAQALRRQREIHSETGRKPFLAALRYETTAQSWWGTKEPILMINTPRSHYTITQEFNHSLDSWMGADALVITTEKYLKNPLDDAKFDSCTPEEFRTYRGDELSRIFTLWWCRNFQGIR